MFRFMRRKTKHPFKNIQWPQSHTHSHIESMLWNVCQGCKGNSCFKNDLKHMQDWCSVGLISPTSVSGTFPNGGIEPYEGPFEAWFFLNISLHTWGFLHFMYLKYLVMIPSFQSHFGLQVPGLPVWFFSVLPGGCSLPFAGRLIRGVASFVVVMIPGQETLIMRRCTGKVDQGNITSEDQEVTPRKMNESNLKSWWFGSDDFSRTSRGVFSCSKANLPGCTWLGSYQDGGLVSG